MKDILLAFLPPLSAALFTYLLTNLSLKNGSRVKRQRETVEKNSERHIVYRFFMFFLCYSSCFIRAALVYAVSRGAYMILGMISGWPRIPIWWEVFVWWLMTAYMICLVVAIQLARIDDMEK